MVALIVQRYSDHLEDKGFSCTCGTKKTSGERWYHLCKPANFDQDELAMLGGCERLLDVPGNVRTDESQRLQLRTLISKRVAKATMAIP